ncbi:MAG: ATP-binding protein [Bacteroidota bacterium]
MWIRSSGRVVRHDASGAPVRMLGTHVNIDREYRAARELADRERLLDQAGRISKFGGWSFDLATNEVMWSSSLRELFEVPDDFEPSYTAAVDMYKPWSVRVLREAISQAIQDHASYELELEVTSAKGRDMWVRVFGEPEVVDGVCVRLTGAVLDITDQQAASEAIERTSMVLSETSMLAGVGGFELDPATRCLAWSTEAKDVLPFDVSGQALLETFLGSVARRDREDLRSAFTTCLSTGEPFDREVRILTEGAGDSWFRIIGTSRGTTSGVTGLVGVVQNITEQKRSHLRLREMTRAAEDANRAKSDFLANMSHEIRTPMTAILGFADTLAEADQTERERADAVRTIRRNGEHLLEIINDILDMSRIEAGGMSLEMIDASPIGVVKEACDLMRSRSLAKGVAFGLELKSPVPERVVTDPTRLRQIVINLVGNAVKFTDEGSVRVVVSCEGPETRTRLRIDVIDTGLGMTEEQQKKLFRAFSQADGSMSRRFGGTGLGLRISLSLAEMLGGTIEVSSVPGAGTTFTAWIACGDCTGVPTVDALTDGVLEPGTASVERRPGVAAGTARTEKPATPLAGYRVLVAEDGIDNQRLIAMHLKRAGAEHVLVENGLLAVEAATRAKAGGKPFDVIQMDMQMPELDGYGATRRLRSGGYTGQIVAVTAHAMSGDRERCLEAGCNEYLVKPVNAASMIEACRLARAADGGETAADGASGPPESGGSGPADASDSGTAALGNGVDGDHPGGQPGGREAA